MGVIKASERSATLAFSPTAPYIAAGTMAGAIDMSFSSSACLEIFKLDFANPSVDMPLAGGAVGTNERFHRLVWGTTGLETSSYPYGIIAGGLVDGTVNLWNPAKILGTDVNADQVEDGSPLISKLQKHTGGVKGLEFNSFSPNLLASGAADGELVIWDLSDPATPSLYPALKSGAGNGASAAGEITYLAWNRKVQHILASTSANGTTVVWDLKRQRPVISFNDPNGNRRNSCIQWNPEVATQLIVASDDDRSPSLQVWDLRNAVSPQRELCYHTKGVLSMAWCTQDTGLLLSSSKDNQTLCWDTNTGEVIAELPSSTNWNFDVQWSPRAPGILSTASFDGKVSLHNLQNASAPGESAQGVGVSADFSTVTSTPSGPRKPMARAPAFMRRPCSVQFGFGGRLLSQRPGEVKLHTSLVTDSALVAASSEFETALASGDKPAMREFCHKKIGGAQDDVEREVWSFLRVLFEDDARRQLLAHLDFELPQPKDQSEPAASGPEAEPAAVENATEPPATPPQTETAAAEPKALPVDDGAGFFDEVQDDEAFFDNLTGETPPPKPKPAEQDPKPEPVPPTAETPAPVAPKVADQPAPNASPVKLTEKEIEAEATIQRSLVVGDYASAVDACLAVHRMADALMLASLGGAELWSKAQKAFMDSEPRPYMKTVDALMNKDLKGLVESRALGAWRETLALLCTYASKAEWAELAEALAARLASAGSVAPATLCYICAGAVEQAASIWCQAYQDAAGEKTKTQSVRVLHSMMEKAVVLIRATGTRATSPSLAHVMNEYAMLLVSQGQLGTAMKYLQMLPGEDTHSTAVLRDRIYRSGLVSNQMQAPPFPFVAEEVPTSAHPAPTAAHPQVQQQQAQHQPAPVQQQQQQQQQPMYQQHQQPVQPVYAQPQQPQQAQSFYQPVQPQAAYAPQQPQFQAPPQPAPTPTYQPQTTAPTAAYAPAQAAYQPAQQPTPAQQPAPAQHQQHHQQPMVPQAAHAQPAVFQPQSFQPQSVAAPAPTPQYAPTAAPPLQPGVVAPAAQQRPVPPAPAPAPVPTGPPANLNLDNVDTSAVQEGLKPVVTSLTNLFRACAANAQAGAKKRESDDNSKRLAQLFYKLNAGDVSTTVSTKMLQLCAALDSGDYATATHIQVGLTTSDWDECSHWLTALKRLVKTRQTIG